jgi:hypothetical protein
MEKSPSNCLNIDYLTDCTMDAQASFQVFAAAWLAIPFFWDMTLRQWADGSQCFDGS